MSAAPTGFFKFRVFKRKPFALLVLPICVTGVIADAATNSGVVYHGRILKQDGSPLQGSAVQFQLTIRSPGSEDCLLYQEIQTLNMQGSNGVFSITLNDGSGTRTDTTGIAFNNIFSNRSAFTLPPVNCNSTTTYTPNSSDGRSFAVAFRDENMPTFEKLPSQQIQFSPAAIQSLNVGGYAPANLLKFDDSVLTANASPLNNTQYNSLIALINGTSTQYMKSSATGGGALPVVSSAPSGATAGSIWFDSTTHTIKYNDGTTTQSVGSGSGTGTVTSITAGAGLSGGTITTSGTISLPTVGTADSYYKVTTDAYGRVSSGSTSLIESDIPNLTTAGHVSGDTITSGTIGGSTVINTSGSIYGSSVGEKTVYVYNSAATHKLAITAPSLTSDYSFIFPDSAGASGNVLATDGAGHLSWATAGGAPTGAAGGDLSGTYPNPSVKAVRGVTVSATGPTAAGQTLRYDGTSSYVPGYVLSADVRSSMAGNAAFFPAACGASQALTYSSISDTLTCATISAAGLSGTLSAANGGTGSVSPAAHGVMVAEGASAMNALVGSDGTMLQAATGVDPSFTAGATLGNGSTNGTLTLKNTGTGSVKLSANTSSTIAYTFALPTSGGTSGYLLQTDGSGNTSWVAASGSGTVNSGTANQLAYYSASGAAVGGLNTANDAVLITNGSGVPAWSTLTTDNFTQYALLAGRAGGQTFKGGTAASENLTLDSTASATKGSILLAPTGGNVGIGTSSPGAKLEIGSRSTYTAQAGDQVLVTNEAGATAIRLLSANGYTEGLYLSGYAGSSPSYIANDSSAQRLRLGTAGADRLAIDSAGHVGIGTLSPASGSILDVNGTGTTASSIVLPRDTTANRPTGVAGMVRYNTSLNSLEFYNGSAWIAPASGSTGNFSAAASVYFSHAGIYIPNDSSTAAPASSASYSFISTNASNTDNVAASLRLKVFNAAGNGQNAFIGAVSTTNATSSTTPSLVFGQQSGATAYTERMRIDPSGNIGIGTTSPASLLDVAGAIRIAPATLPASPIAGQIAIDSGASNALKFYNGSGWQAVSTGSGSVNSGTANQLAYYSASGAAVGGLTSVNSAVLTTNASGVPAWSALTTDNFAQYALLAGRAGGQSLSGGTAASENLTLDSTTNSTKGFVLLGTSGSNVGVGTTTPGNTLDIYRSGNDPATSTVTRIRNSPTFTATSSNDYTGLSAYANPNGSGTTNLSGEFDAIQSLAYINGAIGTVSSMNGARISYGMKTGSTGTMTNARGLWLTPYFQAGTITNAYGVRIDGSTGGTVTNEYGIYQTSTTAKNFYGGSVGIGTASPAVPLEIQNTAAGSEVIAASLHNSSSTANSAVTLDLSPVSSAPNIRAGQITAVNNGGNQISLLFKTSNAGIPAERMRIDYQGYVGIGTTSPSGQFEINTGSAGTSTGITINTTTVGANTYEYYKANGTVIGSITSAAGANVAFNTTSDVRLKGGFTEVARPLETLSRIEVSNFYYLKDPLQTRMDGFKAQQLYDVVPYAVTKPSKDVEDDGSVTPWQADYSKVVPLITAAVQELYRKFLGVDDRLKSQEQVIARLNARVESAEHLQAEKSRELEAVKARLERLEERLQTQEH